MISLAASRETIIRRKVQEKKEEKMGAYTTLRDTLRKFLKSDDFKAGVISSTKAGWGGSSYKVELFPDGTWRVLWANEIGNLYETPGVILALPQMDTDDMHETIDNGGANDEDDYLSMAFETTRQELKTEIRDSFSDFATLNGVAFS
jgi:hypothetical protein